MTIEELKSKVESYRAGLKEKDGKPVVFSQTGPVGMVLIDALVAALETQAKQIAALQHGGGLR